MHPGPVNRGVELSGDVVDSPQSLVLEQVAAGRRRADGGALRGARLDPRRRARHGAPARMSDRLLHDALVRAPAPPADLLVRARARARPARRARRRRTTCWSATAGSPRSARPGRSRRPSAPRSSTARAAGSSRAFVDPHVHLRTPGQEHKEDLETGTRAAAAGGFCQVIAMPNTDPVVDSPSILGALRETAARDARIPVGFMAAITRGLRGEELTEMDGLREAGALGFTDDGKPVVSAGMLRRALQYQRLCGGVLALHEEDPALSGAGVMHEGVDQHAARRRRASRASASRRWSRATRRSPATRAARAHAAPELRGLGRGGRAGQGARLPRHLRGEPAPPLPHRRGGAHARHEHEDEPAAARPRPTARR